jgi:DNA-binding SARP family transcriptional activator/tetratricopeptide (TPR) repeat protein
VTEFRLLGPVQLHTDGGTPSLGPPKQRNVLAALLVDAGRPVPTDILVDRVWDDSPPVEARNALYAHIMRIRRLLAKVAGDGEHTVRLERRPGGYALEVDPDLVDYHRFRRLVDQARDPQTGDHQRAELLRGALELWRGVPLADLAGEWVERVRTGWQQQHLEAVLAWARSELLAGEPGLVIDRVRDLATEHPLVEPLAAVLMRALHAAGRHAEALDAYAKLQYRLAEALGADPSSELQQLHQAILRGDLAPPVSPPTEAAAVLPAQLPADVSRFTARTAELIELDKALTGADGLPRPVIITGTAGVGKTALAVHWAHRVRDRFGDGQLYVNLRGFDPSGAVMSPAEAIRSFLDAMGVPPSRIPTGLDAQAGLYRSLLAERQALVVLDNARDTDQVRPLLPGAAGCQVLVTSRNQLSGLVVAAGAHPVTLDLLTPAEATALLANRVGPARTAAEPSAVAEIVTRCARLPLALAVVAARAVTHPQFSLATLAGELFASQDGLDAFANVDRAVDVRSVFSWSYRQLSADAARLFRLLGLHPGPDLGTLAAAGLAGIPAGQARSLLAELTRASLLSEHTRGRYAFHDLLRVYAAELSGALDTEVDRRAAVHRMLDHYLHTAHAAAMLFDIRDPIDLADAMPGVTVECPTCAESASAWFATERCVLLAAAGRAATTGFDTHVWQLAWAVADYLDYGAHWHDWVATQLAAVEATRRLADRQTEAWAHSGLARAYSKLGRHQDAETHHRCALELARQVGDPVRQAHAHIGLTNLFELRSDFGRALHHAELALDLFRTAGHRTGQARALNNIGWFQALLGSHRPALESCRRALVLHRECGNRSGEAHTWDSLGYAHHHLGEHTEALEAYGLALDLFRGLGGRLHEALTLTRVGDTHRAGGSPEAARHSWQAAVEILVELDHPDAAAVREKLDLPSVAGRPSSSRAHQPC